MDQIAHTHSAAQIKANFISHALLDRPPTLTTPFLSFASVTLFYTAHNKAAKKWRCFSIVGPVDAWNPAKLFFFSHLGKSFIKEFFDSEVVQ